MTVLTLYMPLWLMVRGKISAGHILVGYTGMLLLGAASVAIGLFASSLARSQVVAVILGASIMAPLLMLWMLARAVDPPLNTFLSALALLIGGLFLVFTGIANWRIPLSMIVGIIIFGGVFWLIDPVAYPDPVFHIFAGGFLFGAFFMATDWVTSPMTSKGIWIYGLGISLMVVMIRLFGGLPEGVMYSILFFNALVPLINRYTKPRIFGESK